MFAHIKMFVLTAVIALSLSAVTGCGSDNLVDQYAKRVEATCACKDMACLEAAHKDLDAWRREHKSDYKKLSAADKKKTKSLKRKLRQCSAKIAGEKEK